MTVIEGLGKYDYRRPTAKRRVVMMKYESPTGYCHPPEEFHVLDVQHHPVITLVVCWGAVFVRHIPLSSCWNEVA